MEKPALRSGAPLHGGAHAVAVAQIDVVPHADLVAVIDDRGAGHGEQQTVQQFDLAAVVAQQGRQTAADADVDAHARILGVYPVHVVPLLVGHHLQGQLVVIAQKHRPLAAVGNGRRLLQDVDDGVAVLHAAGP